MWRVVLLLLLVLPLGEGEGGGGGVEERMEEVEWRSKIHSKYFLSATVRRADGERKGKGRRGDQPGHFPERSSDRSETARMPPHRVGGHIRTAPEDSAESTPRSGFAQHGGLALDTEMTAAVSEALEKACRPLAATHNRHPKAKPRLFTAPRLPRLPRCQK